jgi:hypothetical protein
MDTFKTQLEAWAYPVDFITGLSMVASLAQPNSTPESSLSTGFDFFGN